MVSRGPLQGGTEAAGRSALGRVCVAAPRPARAAVPAEPRGAVLWAAWGGAAEGLAAFVPWERASLQVFPGTGVCVAWEQCLAIGRPRLWWGRPGENESRSGRQLVAPKAVQHRLARPSEPAPRAAACSSGSWCARCPLGARLPPRSGRGPGLSPRSWARVLPAGLTPVPAGVPRGAPAGLPAHRAHAAAAAGAAGRAGGPAAAVRRGAGHGGPPQHHRGAGACWPRVLCPQWLFSEPSFS